MPDTEKDRPIIHKAGCGWATGPYCTCGADPERPAEKDAAECDCESMGGRFGSHRPECPWQVAFEAQLAAEKDAGRVLATPVRPYPPGAPLVAVHESAWQDAQDAEAQVPELQDQLANVTAYAEAMPAKIADFLLAYSADGDAKDPWQAGHNYAMREAARMVSERWHEIETPFRLHYRGDGPNGETTVCECESEPTMTSDTSVLPPAESEAGR